MMSVPRVKAHIIEFTERGVPCAFKPRTVTCFRPFTMQVAFRPMFFSHTAAGEGALDALSLSSLRIGRREQFVGGPVPLRYVLECPHWDLETLLPDTGLTFSVWNPSALAHTVTDLRLHGIIPE